MAPHVVIVGAGFAGLYCARSLRRAPVRLTVVDRKNHHVFQPLLYQVATAALNPSDIAAPIRRVLRRQANATVLLAEVVGVDLDAKKVRLADGELDYDHLVIATGVTHAYFGHDEWEPHAPGLKSIEDALEIRRRVLLAFELAERADDDAVRKACLTFVVVGGGPTGVELAGALAEISRHALEKDFRRIAPQEARILLVEAGDRILPSYPPKLSAKAERQLVGLGAQVRTKSPVTKVDAEGVLLGEERIAARTVLWAAGVAGSPLARVLGAPLDRAGRVRVRPDLTIPDRDDVWVIGDLAAIEEGGKPVPGVAPAAMQEGRHVARSIERRVRGRAAEPFHYVDKGSLATIGRSRAVADLRGLRLSGLLAWLAWLFIHIWYLIGFRNRLLVFLEWGWAWLTFDRGARLITGDRRETR